MGWPRFLAVALLMFCPLLAAQDSASQGPKQLPADVRVVIDVSGSMKQNDPSNLRQPAVELLVQLLPEGSKAGIWTFGRYINMLVPHRPVNDEWKRNATRLSMAFLYDERMLYPWKVPYATRLSIAAG